MYFSCDQRGHELELLQHILSAARRICHKVQNGQRRNVGHRNSDAQPRVDEFEEHTKSYILHMRCVDAVSQVRCYILHYVHDDEQRCTKRVRNVYCRSSAGHIRASNTVVSSTIVHILCMTKKSWLHKSIQLSDKTSKIVHKMLQDMMLGTLDKNRTAEHQDKVSLKATGKGKLKTQADWRVFKGQVYWDLKRTNRSGRPQRQTQTKSLQVQHLQRKRHYRQHRNAIEC